MPGVRLARTHGGGEGSEGAREGVGGPRVGARGGGGGGPELTQYHPLLALPLPLPLSLPLPSLFPFYFPLGDGQ